LQLEKLELANHLDTVSDMAMQYRDIAFDLYHQLRPPPAEGEMDTDGELADGGEPDHDPAVKRNTTLTTTTRGTTTAITTTTRATVPTTPTSSVELRAASL